MFMPVCSASGLFLGLIMNSIAEVDSAIRGAGFCEGDVLRVAGFGSRYLYNIRSGYRPLTPRTVTRLQLALAQLKRNRSIEKRGRQVASQFPERGAALRSYRLAIAMVAQSAGVKPAFILDADPAKRATADPLWLRAARLRRLAIYIAITYLDISQSEMARAVGVSKGTVCALLAELGDERDQPEIEAALSYVEEAFQS
jgi:hypothetical protein